MPLNARVKGGTGEREIALSLNGAIGVTMKEMGFPDTLVQKGFTQVQRNQNQSAVGGKDLVGVFGLAVEVKRCEVLELKKWWAQACASAAREDEIPVLLYRQNNKPWHAMLHGQILVPSGLNGEQYFTTPVIISWEAFLIWFKQYIRAQLPLAYKMAA